ncbi:hypothetical protein LVY65_01680 [Sphingomonas sp. G124]|uniref:Uncharacterized protein n=1 Tax=Sphingomonas cremea TaxID=2904799 RepID=A0A9X1QJN3_9SPHN|nr:hypothetical protein [Sphingomonas cremea]MCF2513779.1 hypothetical protein [Sphingomonas cremea]
MAAAFLILLAACDDGDHYALEGEWDWVDERSKYPQSCRSAVTLRYYSNGKYYLLGEVETWRLEGNVLTAVATDFVQFDDNSEHGQVGDTIVSTLRWIDGNAFVARHADGKEIEYRRCPEWN